MKPVFNVTRINSFHGLLLRCGLFATILYIAMNVFIPMAYKGYNAASQTVSELSAIDAPTRQAWILFAAVYSFFMFSFGWGIRIAADNNKRLRTAGTLIMIYSLVGLFWPPMHQRTVLAAGGGSLTDTLHIVFTFVSVGLMITAVIFSGIALKKGFRAYAFITIAAEVFFGILTGMDAPAMQQDLPTPMMGVWERAGIAAHMLWVAVLALYLLSNKKVRHQMFEPPGVRKRASHSKTAA